MASVCTLNWLLAAAWLAPDNSAFDSQFQTPVVDLDGAFMAQILQRPAHLRVESGNGSRAHVGTRKTALGVATLQVFVDGRAPRLRAAALLAEWVEQSALRELIKQVVWAEVAYG